MNFHEKYLIGPHLGSGAYGAVYKIYEKTQKKWYVVKLFNMKALKKDRIFKANAKGRSAGLKGKELKAYIGKATRAVEQTMIKEYQMLKKIKGIDNVVQYYEYYPSIKYKNIKYSGIVMEYIEGRELWDFYHCANKVEKSIPKSILQKFMLEMFRTVAELHERNIVHRDIKLENVLFNSQELKLVDFGFSCFTDMEHGILDCQKNRIVGTPRYQSPELLDMEFNENMDILKAVDIWALGVMFYALANIRFPFRGADKEFLRKAILSGKHTPSKYEDDNINKIIELALTKNWKKRPTAQQLYNMALNKIENVL